MASLYDYYRAEGVIKAIGCDGDLHRRLVDMGLSGRAFRIKARRKGALLVDYGDFSAVTRAELAKQLTVADK